MNIWIFNHYAVPLKYYPHGRPHYFAKYLAEAGHTVTVFAASTVHNSNRNMILDKRSYIKGKSGKVSYIFLKTSNYKGNGAKRIFNMFQYMMGLFRIERKVKKPDCILAMSVHPLTCVAGILLAKKYHCRCIVDIADLWPESLAAYNIIDKNNVFLKLLYKGEKWIYKKADEVIFTMAGGKDYIREKGWEREVPKKKVHHINNGVDLETFDYNKKHFITDTEDLNETESFKVIYVGSIRKANQLDLLVQCAEQLNQNNTNIKFFIWGDGDEKEKLEKLCKEKKLSNIKWKGIIEKKYIPYILSKADLNLFQVSDSDILRFGCSSNKLFDYMASGKPVLSTVMTNYSLVKKYKCGRCSDINSAKQLAEQIEAMKQLGEKQRNEMGKNARKCAEQYDFKNLTQKLEIILTGYKI